MLAGSMSDVVTFVIIAPESARLRTNVKISFSSPAIRSPAGPAGDAEVSGGGNYGLTV